MILFVLPFLRKPDRQSLKPLSIHPQILAKSVLFKVRMSLGLILLNTGQLDEGREHLAKALQLKPKDAYANY